MGDALQGGGIQERVLGGQDVLWTMLCDGLGASLAWRPVKIGSL